MKPSKTQFRVIRGGRAPHREVFHVCLVEGPPPASLVIAYAAYGEGPAGGAFPFAPVGLPVTDRVIPFPSRPSAEAFAAEAFPGVPCTFVPWVVFGMLTTLAGGA